jgi:hydroxymethylglutaryl-CoA lyase
MAKDDLTGNMPTEVVLNFFSGHKIESGINMLNFEKTFEFSSRIFNV